VFKTRTETRGALIVLGLALALTFIGPTPTQPASVQKWDDKVGRARGVVRAALAEQNLPGLSINAASGRTFRATSRPRRVSRER